jgi:predicted acetyltransferase
MTLRLRPFTLDDEAVARDIHGNFDTGFIFLLDFDPAQTWESWLNQMANRELGIVEEGRVRSAFLAAEVNGQIVGRVSIRFELNEFLATRGGHIGYGVVASERGQGYATSMLRLALAMLAREGVERALVTVDDSNLASRAVIEHCGGVFESFIADGERTLRRYWCPTAHSAPALT